MTFHGYSSDDKVNSARLPSGGVFNRTYDGYDRIVKDVFTPQQMAETGEKTARGKGAKVESSYTYLDTDRKEADGKTVRGNTTTYKYTTRLLSGLETTVGTGANQTGKYKETLSYDDLNRVADHNGIVYTYDDLGRLIKARDKAKDRTWEYSYDSLGNITGSIFYDKGVRQEETYKYDKQNLIDYNKEAISSYTGGNPKLYRGNNLTWQHGKQLNSIKPRLLKNANSVSDPVDYTYTHEGIRLSKTVGKKLFNPGTRTDYILNGSLILAEKISRKGEEDEVLSYYYTAEGKLLEIGYKKGDEKENHYSVIRNAMGDVTALYTAEGILVGTYEYDPYGKLLAETPNTAFEDKDGILNKNPFRYRGYYYDKETGWYYLQSRYYDPQIKRFINADTTDLLTTDCENLMQYNLFMYCNGDPVNNVDPSGHIAIEAVVAIILIVAIVITIAVLTANLASNNEGYRSFVEQASKAINNLLEPHDQNVYMLRDGKGDVAYVGRTNEVSRRMDEHSRNIFHRGLTLDIKKDVYYGLTKEEARGLEQALMIEHYTKNKGVPTANQINGVGHNNSRAMVYFISAYNYAKNNPACRYISNNVWDELYNWKESNW